MRKRTVVPQIIDGVTWRTNIGLCLTPELGRALEAKCAEENRTFVNYIQTLIIRELKGYVRPSRNENGLQEDHQ